MELAWAVPLGTEPGVRALTPETSLSGREALEQVARRALTRQPCTVSFSGGRDSSAVLAIVTHVARRDGLPDPIPITNCFTDVPASDEQAWQEIVIRHLKLSEWTRLELGDEVDMLGDIAKDVVERHGVLSPFNSHFHVPLLAAARGGSLLTGIGGDELFEPTERAALARLLFGGRLPNRRQIKPLLRAIMPRFLRVRQAMREPAFHKYQWLRPGALAEIRRRYGEWVAEEPVGYRRSMLTWWWPSRYVQCNLASKRLLAGDHNVEIFHPFADPAVLSAYGQGRGRLGPPGRVWALRELVGDLLPASIIERESESNFDGAFWCGPGRAFAEGWTGTGVDDDLVDAERLRAEWLTPQPDPHSFSLLHQAFLADNVVADVEGSRRGRAGLHLPDRNPHE